MNPCHDLSRRPCCMLPCRAETTAARTDATDSCPKPDQIVLSRPQQASSADLSSASSLQRSRSAWHTPYRRGAGSGRTALPTHRLRRAPLTNAIISRRVAGERVLRLHHVRAALRQQGALGRGGAVRVWRRGCVQGQQLWPHARGVPRARVGQVVHVQTPGHLWIVVDGPLSAHVTAPRAPASGPSKRWCGKAAGGVTACVAAVLSASRGA
jgi:hypothetical protein